MKFMSFLEEDEFKGNGVNVRPCAGQKMRIPRPPCGL